MKYLMFYEGFESRILKSTLGFINKDEKNDFINLLKNLCVSIDFPFSKLSDDFFEYLPFKKALWKNDMTGDEPCGATSKKAFPEYAVEGEVCKGGKIKRLWGSRTRDVECPVCHGTGLKEKEEELKLLKFWFSKDGKFINTTAVDGIVSKSRGQKAKSTSRPITSKPTAFSTNLDDYEVVKSDLSLEEIRSLEDGTIVYFTNRNDESGVAYVYKRPGTATYFLQNFTSGSEPRGSEWENIAPRSWVISSRDDFKKVDILKKSKIKKEEEIDPYTWNARTIFRRNNIRTMDSGSIFDEVVDAHFAIVLDFGKLKLSGYKPKSEISSERTEMKSGALALKTDEQIKKENIERYLNELVKKSDIVSDVSNANRVVKRLFGGNLLLFLIMGERSNYYKDFTELISLYYNCIKENNETNKEYYLSRLTEFIKSKYNMTENYTTNINNNLKLIYNRINSDNEISEEYKEKSIIILDQLQKMSKMVYEKMISDEIETIEDLEIISIKFNSIRELLRSHRYPFYELYYVWEYLSRKDIDSFYYYLTSHYYMRDNIDKIVQSLPIMERLLSRI
jgi:hypothetical protein